MEPSTDRSAADWESTWASLTFVRPATHSNANPTAANAAALQTK
jgi:hypothetical protein